MFCRPGWSIQLTRFFFLYLEMFGTPKKSFFTMIFFLCVCLDSDSHDNSKTESLGKFWCQYVWISKAKILASELRVQKSRKLRFLYDYFFFKFSSGKDINNHVTQFRNKSWLLHSKFLLEELYLYSQPSSTPHQFVKFVDNLPSLENVFIFPYKFLIILFL